MPSPSSPRLRFASLTHPGRVRARNEDAVAIVAEHELAIVCDGMGGHAGGDVASGVVAEALGKFFRQVPTPVPEAEAEALIHVAQAVEFANRRLIARANDEPSAPLRGMGTTLAGFWRIPGTDRAVIFHVGDSRVYRWRGGELVQLTHDHSLYQAWCDGGRVGVEPPRNIIMRALGCQPPSATPDIRVVPLHGGDLFLLCSDGLTTMASDAQIGAIVERRDPAALDPLCHALVDAANAAGGRDNITVALAHCPPAPSGD